DASPLIDAARNAFEAHGNVALPAILHVLRDDIWGIRTGLQPGEGFGLWLAVQRTRLLGDPGGGLPFLPLTAIDRQHLVSALIVNPPKADDTHEGLLFGTYSVIGKCNLHGLLCRHHG